MYPVRRLTVQRSRGKCCALFSALVPDVRVAQLHPIGAFLVPRIIEQLAAEGLPAELVGVTGSCAKTADRSVLGCMNDLALHCGRAVADAGGLARVDLVAPHHRPQRNITSARDYVPAIELLTTRHDV